MSKKVDNVKVLGRYVYINVPETPESKIQVDHNTKKDLDAALLKKMARLEVWKKGDQANKLIKEGAFVLVNPGALSQAQMVPFEENGKSINRALIQDFDIIHIWDHEEV